MKLNFMVFIWCSEELNKVFCLSVAWKWLHYADLSWCTILSVKMNTQLRTQYPSIQTGQMVNLHCVWKTIIKWTHSQANGYLICVEAGFQGSAPEKWKCAIVQNNVRIQAHLIFLESVHILYLEPPESIISGWSWCMCPHLWVYQRNRCSSMHRLKLLLFFFLFFFFL